MHFFFCTGMLSFDIHTFSWAVYFVFSHLFTFLTCCLVGDLILNVSPYCK